MKSTIVSVNLSELALAKYSEMEEKNSIYVSEQTKAYTKEANRQYNLLMERFKDDPEVVRMLLNYDDTLSFWASSQREDGFVHGFQKGVRL